MRGKQRKPPPIAAILLTISHEAAHNLYRERYPERIMNENREFEEHLYVYLYEYKVAKAYEKHMSTNNPNWKFQSQDYKALTEVKDQINAWIQHYRNALNIFPKLTDEEIWQEFQDKLLTSH